jgi:hypothetical protein
MNGFRFAGSRLVCKTLSLLAVLPLDIGARQNLDSPGPEILQASQRTESAPVAQTNDWPGPRPKAIVDFPVQAALDVATSAGSCKFSPQFIAVFKDSKLRETLAAALDGDALQPMTVLRSQGNSVAARRFAEVAELWQTSAGSTAACLAQCVKLPPLARLTRIVLTNADGRTRCEQLPGRSIPSLQAASVDCGDGTRWQEIVAKPASGRWLVCAAVTNTATTPARSRMGLDYEYRTVQIGTTAQ